MTMVRFLNDLTGEHILLPCVLNALHIAESISETGLAGRHPVEIAANCEGFVASTKRKFLY
jgi:hypothetical protein